MNDNDVPGVSDGLEIKVTAEDYAKLFASCPKRRTSPVAFAAWHQVGAIRGGSRRIPQQVDRQRHAARVL
jgi:hypothetical protein